MKNTYAWAIIVLVLIAFGAAIWYMMNNLNDGSITTAQNPSVLLHTLSGKLHLGSSGTTGTTAASGSTGTTGTGTTGSTDLRPTITSITPASAKVGAVAMITGTNFDATTNVITFGPSMGLHRTDGTADNQVGSLPSANGTLTFTVPAAIESGTLCDASGKCGTYGPQGTTAGSYMVTVVNKSGVSNTFPFTVTE